MVCIVLISKITFQKIRFLDIHEIDQFTFFVQKAEFIIQQHYENIWLFTLSKKYYSDKISNTSLSSKSNKTWTKFRRNNHLIFTDILLCKLFSLSIYFCIMPIICSVRVSVLILQFTVYAINTSYLKLLIILPHSPIQNQKTLLNCWWLFPTLKQPPTFLYSAFNIPEASPQL